MRQEGKSPINASKSHSFVIELKNPCQHTSPCLAIAAWSLECSSACGAANESISFRSMPGGRQTTYSPTILPLVQCAATFGATAEEVAAYLQISWRCFYRWMLVEPELKQALKLGREASDNRVVDSLYKNAIAGNVTAQIFWLKNRRPSEWRDVQNIQADVGHYIVADRPMSEEEWITARADRALPVQQAVQHEASPQVPTSDSDTANPLE